MQLLGGVVLRDVMSDKRSLKFGDENTVFGDMF